MSSPNSTLKTFHFKNKSFFCEDIPIDQFLNILPAKHVISIRGIPITTEVPATPIFVYSSAALARNVQKYIAGMRNCGLDGVLGFATKSNGNLHILEHLKKCGVKMLVTVSGYEVLAGLKVGFQPHQIIFNGNGKQSWEIKLSIEQGVLLNVDSIFDAKRIISIIKELNHSAEVQVLLRIRPSRNECEVGVHPYVNTSDDSKFGFDNTEMDQVLETLLEVKTLRIVGIHCHLGSCITDPTVYSFMGKFVTEVSRMLEAKGLPQLKFLNIGGGIGVDYFSIPPGFKEFWSEAPNKDAPIYSSSCSSKPNILEFIQNLAKVVPKGVKVIVEPGRSLVADAGIIVTSVLGTKKSASRKFMVVDSSMTELIRPCLYGSHHQIFPTILNSTKEWTKFEVVGPVCESADFLGHNILLPENAQHVAILDCGAYASSMSSNYNMRPKPAEILVDGKNWKCIRSRETFENLLSTQSSFKSELEIHDSTVQNGENV